MNAERYQQIKRIFETVHELVGTEREAMLVELCGDDAELLREVRLWLTHHDATDPLVEGPTVAPGPGVDDVSAHLHGAMPSEDRAERASDIGPYRVLRRLGKGGMGVVYLVEREQGGVRRPFAIKIMLDRAEKTEILRRFDRERRILAALAHDGIAKLHDVGETDDGRPYFVMEYVDGLPIDRYCDEHRLDIDARLQLFCRVCDAVQFAHNAQVVHRDLKPSNILVTRDGRPKLLDFGIARYTNPIMAMIEGDVTLGRIQPHTPEYASPEQVRHDTVVGTASDVYSLGVILYELVSGHRPYRIANALAEEYRNIILTAEPRRPSIAVESVEHLGDPSDPGTRAITPDDVSRSRRRHPTQLRRRLEGDVDNIVLMAMRKEAERRYPTAHALAEDIRRHLDGMPVTARADTLGYRTSKFVRRHRGALGVASVVATAVVVALVVTLLSLGRARAAERRALDAQALAQQRFESSWGLARSLLRDLDPDLRVLIGGQKVREKIAQLAIEHLETLESDPAFDEGPTFLLDIARGWRLVGDIEGSERTDSKGDPASALRYYRRSEAVLDRADAGSGGADDASVLERAALLRGIASAHGGLKAYEERDGTRAKAIALLESRFGSDPENAAAAWQMMALMNDVNASHRDDTVAQARAEALLARLEQDPDWAASVRRDRMMAMDKQMFPAMESAPTPEEGMRRALEIAMARLAIARALHGLHPESTQATRDLVQGLAWVAQFGGDSRLLGEAVDLARALHLLNVGVERDRANFAFSLLLRASDDDLAPHRRLIDAVEALQVLGTDGRCMADAALPSLTLSICRTASAAPGAGGPSDELVRHAIAALDRATQWPDAPEVAIELRILLAELLATRSTSDALIEGAALLDEVIMALASEVWRVPDRAQSRALLLGRAAVALAHVDANARRTPLLRDEAIAALKQAYGSAPEDAAATALLAALRAIDVPNRD